MDMNMNMICLHTTICINFVLKILHKIFVRSPALALPSLLPDFYLYFIVGLQVFLVCMVPLSQRYHDFHHLVGSIFHHWHLFKSICLFRWYFISTNKYFLIFSDYIIKIFARNIGIVNVSLFYTDILNLKWIYHSCTNSKSHRKITFSHKIYRVGNWLWWAKTNDQLF